MRTVPELFESTVARFPDAPAVRSSETTLRYAELNGKANQLARQLIARGVGPDSLVAVSVPRSADLIVTLLAVLKAGGAYLPLDPTYPGERLSYMISDARPTLLVRAAAVSVHDSTVPELVVDDPTFRAECAQEAADDISAHERLALLRPPHLMYVIYTSGSTGKPKGVAITHAGVADMAATQAATIGAGPGDHVLQWASISFDAAFWDICLALLSGATLVMANAEEVLPGEPLKETLTRYAITHATLPPVALSVTDTDGVLPAGTVMSTGDACTPTLVRKWAPGRRMFNGYGPTEVTVGATVSGPINDSDDISIGKPWHGDSVYVLDEQLRTVPDGREGELYLTGSGLARGYLRRPGPSATKFVANPFGEPGSRMYRSGDRGWHRADGELFFAGRADAQVKVRGFRIELGEIEAALAGHPAVEMAVASVEGELAAARIVGYVTTSPGSTVSPVDLRRHVARSLPEHMVPSTVVLIEHLPTTANGKIDRAALRDYLPPRAAPATAATQHNGTSYDDVLCAMVADVLAVPDVTPQDNFFDLGGHSVLATKLASRIRKELGITVPMRAVFEAPTIAELARQVEKAKVA